MRCGPLLEAGAQADEPLLTSLRESAQDSTGSGNSRKPPPGLDVRGADLSGANLSHLPLMRLRAGLSLEEGRHATVEQSRQAAAPVTCWSVRATSAM